LTNVVSLHTPTAEQFRAARAWIGQTLAEVCAGTGICHTTVRKLEGMECSYPPRKLNRALLKQYYEKNGFFFIEGRGLGRREAK